MFDPIETYEVMANTDKRLVGLYQEARLREDASGGDDGMWFEEAVAKVSADQAAAVAYVADAIGVSHDAVLRAAA